MVGTGRPGAVASLWARIGVCTVTPGAQVPVSFETSASGSSPVTTNVPRPAFAVGTGEGLLVPLKLQRAGKQALFAQEFARGERELIGSRLGDVVE